MLITTDSGLSFAFSCICLPGGIARGMSSDARSFLGPWTSPLRVPLANVIIDPLLSGPKEVEKVYSSVFAGLINTQQH